MAASTLAPRDCLRTARQCFAAIPGEPDNEITLLKHLMSGPAMLGLKYPSLLQFQHDCRVETKRANRLALWDRSCTERHALA